MESGAVNCLHILFAILMLSPALSSATSPAGVVSSDVEFRHGDVTMSGTLHVPAARGLHPAMVMMPGSGAQSRAPLQDIARRFAEAGVMTLTYDKQGVGKSAGDWTRESLDDLAGDAAAAVAFLGNSAEVDIRRIGAWGISQSGWVLPRLAKSRSNLAFAICVTGGGATPREVEEYGYRNALLQNGFGEADWLEARPLVERYMQYLAEGKQRDVLLAAIDGARARKWSRFVNVARVLPDAADRARWAWVATYDPAADIRALQMPVLVLIGGRDPFTPSATTTHRWQEGLAAAGDPNDRVISYPAAGHGIRMNGHDLRSAPVYAPGYVADQTSWLRGIGVLK